MEKLKDGPETGEAEYAEKDGEVYALDEERPYASCYTCQQEQGPALCAEMVLSLDDEGMEKADEQEGGQTEENSVVVHADGVDRGCLSFLAAKLQRNARNAKFPHAFPVGEEYLRHIDKRKKKCDFAYIMYFVNALRIARKSRKSNDEVYIGISGVLPTCCK